MLGIQKLKPNILLDIYIRPTLFQREDTKANSEDKNAKGKRFLGPTVHIPILISAPKVLKKRIKQTTLNPKGLHFPHLPEYWWLSRQSWPSSIYIVFPEEKVSQQGFFFFPIAHKWGVRAINYII